MRPPRLARPLSLLGRPAGRFALGLGLALALAACGARPDAATGAGSDATLGAASLPALPSAYAFLHTLANVPAGTDPSQLASMYGGLVLSHNPGAGTAVVANDSAVRGRYDAAVEGNRRLYGIAEQGFGSWSTGFGSWSTGFGSWSTGFGSWSTGATSQATTFLDNVVAWNLVRLSEAQTLAPELGRGVKVAVIDTGIDLAHPAFAGRLDTANAKDFVDGDNVPQEVNGVASGFSDGYGHGTAVAGLVVQVAPRATILPIRALDANGGADTSTIAAAISYAVSRGARVINLSLGGTDNSSAVNRAITDAVSQGVVVTVAAGNTGDTNVLYPAVPAAGGGPQGGGSVSVGSVNVANFKSSFGVYGKDLELSAPGEFLKTVFPNKRTVIATGTSFATPVVSGVLALALGTGAVGTGAASALALMANLDTTATPPIDPLYRTQLGYGTVNAYQLVRKYRP